MLNKMKQAITKYMYMILPICTLLCLAGFIGSYLFPNEVLDTYKVNAKEDEEDQEFVQLLTGAEDEIGYVMETDGRPMKGFQIGVCKNGASLDGSELIYRVYALSEDNKMDANESLDVSSKEEEHAFEIDAYLAPTIDVSKMTLLDEESYSLGECLDGQYPYLPFGNSMCNGKIYITLTYHANGNTEPAPGIYMNHMEILHAATYVNGVKASESSKDANVKCFYIYTHDTYPFLYDSRVMFCIFLAASACVTYPKFKNRKKEAGESYEEN